MIYAVTGRRWWRAARIAPAFTATAMGGGAALALAVTVATAAATGDARALPGLRPLLAVVAGSVVLGVLVQLSVLRHRHEREASELGRTATLLTHELRPLASRALAAAIVGGVVLPLLLLAVWSSPRPSLVASLVLVTAMTGLVLAGELAARRLFFLAVSSPRMPGGM
jgi:Ni/Fe-hydrogenase subunit HybB-like protein